MRFSHDMHLVLHSSLIIIACNTKRLKSHGISLRGLKAIALFSESAAKPDVSLLREVL